MEEYIMKKLLFSAFTIVSMFIGGVGVLASDNLTVKENDDTINIANESYQDIIITEGRFVDGKLVEKDYKMEGRTQRVKNKGDIATLTYNDEVIYTDPSIEADLMFKGKHNPTNLGLGEVTVDKKSNVQVINNDSNKLITLTIKTIDGEMTSLQEIDVPNAGKYKLEKSSVKEEVYLNGVLLAENEEIMTNREKLKLIIPFSIIFFTFIGLMILMTFI